MLGLGLGITKINFFNRLPDWLKAFIKRVKADGGTIEAKKCLKAAGDFLIKNTRAGIIVDTMGKYAITRGGYGLDARDCSAQAVNDLLYDPKPQARFMFLAKDKGLKLENYYCLSNDVDSLEGALSVFGSVTHTYGADISAGEIALSVENGTAPYTYRWSNGATVEDITGLTKGVYNIQVTDSLGAIANNSFTVRGDADPSIVTAGLRMDSYFTNSALEFPALGSAAFNGTSDFIQTDNPFNHTNHTIAAWVYPNGTGSAMYFFDNRDAGGDGIVIARWSDNSILYQLNGNNTFSGNTFNDEWAFVVATYDGTTQKLYFDGSLKRSSTISTTLNVEIDAKIGRASYITGAQFNGNLANVAIWNRALHSDEINAIMWKSYGDLNAVDKNGLQAWYALDNITGTTVPDSTGTNNGTAN